jgi:hypothetical protein
MWKTIDWGRKKSLKPLGPQLDAGQFPVGVPRVDVSMPVELDEMEAGTLARGKNQIEIPVSAYSVTNTPPPLLLKSGP